MSDDAHDLGAEQSLLGAVLVAPESAGDALLAVPPDAWWGQRHAAIASVLAARLRGGDPVDPQTTLIALQARIGLDSQTGPYLITLMQRAWTPANADHYAHRVLRCAARRNLSAAATRVRQQLDASWATGGDEPIGGWTAQLRTACDAAEVADAGVDTEGLSPGLTELLAQPDTHDWLVPGLLERGERMILTGEEGLGKSWFGSQLAATLAAGLHPFTGRVLGDGTHTVRVLVIDCENSIGQTRRRMRRVAACVDAICRSAGLDPAGWRERIRLELRPGGVNLLGADAAWLERRVAANAPDLLLCGPLYRVLDASTTDEPAVRQLLAVFDGIRTRHGCALLSEAHAGHEKDPRGVRRMRPAGSSLQLRWPEYGYGLTRAKDAADAEHPDVVDVVAWRGSREERQWPRQLRHGTFLPWEPADLDYWADAG